MRAQFSDAVNIELGLRSLRDLRDASARASTRRSTCTRSATCSCSTSPTHVAAFEQNVALQNELGVPSRMIDVAEAKRLSPLIEHRRAPRGGLVAQRRALHAGVGRPGVRRGGPPRRRAAGPRLRGHRHRGRRRRHHRRARPAAGRIETDTVVCAAGAWSRADRRHGRGRPPGRAAAPADPDHRADARARPGHPVHHRLLHQLLLPRRGPRAAARHVRPRRDARLQARPVRRLAAAARRGDRATGARARRASASPAAGPGSTR